MLSHYKSVAFLAAAGCACLFSASAASAATIDVASLTCKDMLDAAASNDTDRQFGSTAIMHWLSGYLATEDQDTVMDFGAMKQEFSDVADYCGSHPEISVLKAAGKFMGDNGADETKDVADLSTLKCQRIVDSKPEDTEGLSVILMWIAGYKASSGDATTIDFDALQKASGEIGAYCGQNPEFGLMTAANKFMVDGDSTDSAEATDEVPETDAADATDATASDAGEPDTADATAGPDATDAKAAEEAKAVADAKAAADAKVADEKVAADAKAAADKKAVDAKAVADVKAAADKKAADEKVVADAKAAADKKAAEAKAVADARLPPTRKPQMKRL